MINRQRSNFPNNLEDFLPLWNRANAAVQTLVDSSRTEPTLYFDSIDISTPTFFFFIRALLAFESADTFAVLLRSARTRLPISLIISKNILLSSWAQSTASTTTSHF